MSLHAAKQSDTPVDMGRRRRTNAPREKRGGISIPVHLWSAVDAIVELESEAYDKMGGETKASLSDVLELAVEAYVRQYIKDHGPLPLTEKDRREYVEKLALSNLKSLREELLEE